MVVVGQAPGAHRVRTQSPRMASIAQAQATHRHAPFRGSKTVRQYSGHTLWLRAAIIAQQRATQLTAQLTPLRQVVAVDGSHGTACSSSARGAAPVREPRARLQRWAKPRKTFRRSSTITVDHCSTAIPKRASDNAYKILPPVHASTRPLYGIGSSFI